MGVGSININFSPWICFDGLVATFLLFEISFFLFSFQRFAETRNRETPDRRIFVVDDPIPVVWNTSSWGVGVESVVVKKQPIDKLSPIEFPPFAMITDGVLSLPTSVSFKPIAPVRCGIRSNETCILSREYIVSIYIYIFVVEGKEKGKEKTKRLVAYRNSSGSYSSRYSSWTIFYQITAVMQ